MVVGLCETRLAHHGTELLLSHLLGEIAYVLPVAAAPPPETQREKKKERKNKMFTTTTTTQDKQASKQASVCGLPH